MSTTTTADQLQTGDKVTTSNGQTATITNRWDTTRNGKERIGIALDNGLIYGALRPYDQIGVPAA